MGSFIVPKSYYCIKKEKKERERKEKNEMKGSLYIGVSLLLSHPLSCPASSSTGTDLYNVEILLTF